MEGSRILHILWSNADRHTAQLMVMMYATNSMLNRWWDEVTVIIWGTTAKLVAEDANIQECIKMAENVGVKFSACIACARQLGVVDQLQKLELEVIPWGEPLTDLIQNGKPLLTI